MTEAQFQTKFTKWAKYNIRSSVPVELKISKTNSIPFSRLEPHQERALLSCKQSSLVYKIPDVGYDKKPFDCFVFSNVKHAYVGVMFYVSRGVKHFYLIEIEDWLSFQKSSSRKSLTEEQASQLSPRYEFGVLLSSPL